MGRVKKTGVEKTWTSLISELLLPCHFRLLPDLEDFAIDGTVMKHGNGQLYFAWAGIQAGTSLFVAPLIDPTTVGESMLLLRRPTLPWEGVTVEGPYFFYNNSQTFMGFSGGDTWGPDYALGYMSIPSEKDPMSIDNWWFGPKEPVLYRNDEEGVYTTGHASFTLSPGNGNNK
jgi:GH43 family beta-xylosidase